MKYLLTIVLLMTSCGYEKDKRNARTDRRATAAKITAIEGKLASLESLLNEVNAKEVPVLKDSTEETRAQFDVKLSDLLRIFKDDLYGKGCSGAGSISCPAVGSIAYIGAQQETLIADLNSGVDELKEVDDLLVESIASLEDKVEDLQSRLTAAESMETLLSDLSDDVEMLIWRANHATDRLNTLEASQFLKVGIICGDIPGINQPAEVVLFSDNHQVFIGGAGGHLRTMTRVGCGDLYTTTSESSPSCKYKIYDSGTELKLCWKNTDRSASQTAIDNECLTNSAACSCL